MSYPDLEYSYPSNLSHQSKFYDYHIHYLQSLFKLINIKCNIYKLPNPGTLLKRRLDESSILVFFVTMGFINEYLLYPYPF